MWPGCSTRSASKSQRQFANLNVLSFQKKKSICRCGGTKEEICTTSPSPMKPSLLKALRPWGKGTWNITQSFNSPRFLKSPLMEKSLITKSLITKSLLWHPMAAMHDIGLRESIWVKKIKCKAFNTLGRRLVRNNCAGHICRGCFVVPCKSLLGRE